MPIWAVKVFYALMAAYQADSRLNSEDSRYRKNKSELGFQLGVASVPLFIAGAFLPFTWWAYSAWIALAVAYVAEAAQIKTGILPAAPEPKYLAKGYYGEPPKPKEKSLEELMKELDEPDGNTKHDSK